jgi:hypothetical protein
LAAKTAIQWCGQRVSGWSCGDFHVAADRRFIFDRLEKEFRACNDVIFFELGWQPG